MTIARILRTGMRLSRGRRHVTHKACKREVTIWTQHFTVHDKIIENKTIALCLWWPSRNPGTFDREKTLVAFEFMDFSTE